MRRLFGMALLWIGGLVTLAVAQNRGGQWIPPETPEPPLAKGGGFRDPAIKHAGGEDQVNPKPLPELKASRPLQNEDPYVPKSPLFSGPESPAIQPVQFTSNPVLPIGPSSPYVPVGSPSANLTSGELSPPTVSLFIDGPALSPSRQEIVYKLYVRNLSTSKAHGVNVRASLPKKTAKVGTDPPPTAEGAELRWDLGVLEAGKSRTIQITLRPDEGVEEVKLIAKVQYEFARAVTTTISQPNLALRVDGPEEAVSSEPINYRVTVKNNGKVTIKNIEVYGDLLAGLAFEKEENRRGDGVLVSNTDATGKRRSWTIPSLAPGQTTVIEYKASSKNHGKVGTEVLARADNGVNAKASAETEIKHASLDLQAVGPPGGKGIVRQATPYRVKVTNTGSAELRNVCVKVTMPPDMRATKASVGSNLYQGVVQWTIPALEPGQSREFSLNTSTNSPGERSVLFSARADRGNEPKQEVRVTFDGACALDWDVRGPAQSNIGETIDYFVTLENRGTATAKGVIVKGDFLDGLNFEGADPKVRAGNAGEIEFFPVDVEPNKKVTLTVRVKTTKGGRSGIRFSVSGAGIEPSTKDAPTQILGTASPSPDPKITNPPKQPDKDPLRKT